MDEICPECQTLLDVDEPVHLQVDNETLIACEDCVDEVIFDLELAEPFGKFFVSKNGSDRQIFLSVDDLPKEGQVGFVESTKWSDQAQKAWLGQPGKKASELTLKDIPQTEDGFIYFGFRDHLRNKFPSYRAFLTLSSMLRTPDEQIKFLKKIQEFAMDNHLENHPVIIVSDCDSDVLESFCGDVPIAWFDSIEALKEGRLNKSFVKNPAEATWKRTKNRIQKEIDRFGAEIQKRQAEIASLQFRVDRLKNIL